MRLNLNSSRHRLRLLTALLLIFSGWALALLSRPEPSQPDVPYVDTPPEVVEAMLDLARVDSSDLVFDLGSGDGRIVLAAGRRGARGVGIEIDSSLVAKSRESAEKDGLLDRVRFVESDLFEADLAESSVVFLYLSPRINRELKPKFRSELQSGTRVVSHLFAIDGWEPDEVVLVHGRRLFLYPL